MSHREVRDSIASAGGDPKIKSLENLLRRAQVLNGALNAFQRELITAKPLPPYPVLQSRLSHIQGELNLCKEMMDEHADLLSTTVLLPTLTFPKSGQPILDTLFRTKAEPSVEDWQEQLHKEAIDKDNRQDREKRDGRLTSLPEKDRHELWQEAPIIADREARQHAWFQGDYTMEEVKAGIEHVRHGLKRELKIPELEPDEDDDDEGDFDDVEPPPEAEDEMQLDETQTSTQADATRQQQEGVNPHAQPMPVDSILRLMTRGV